MAEIHVEKKKSIWPWIIAALIALLVIWALIELFDNDADDVAVAPTAIEAPVATAPVTTDPLASTQPLGADTTADSAGAIAVLPVATILSGPAGYVGQSVSGSARVTETPTDRGFWVEQDGQRMFAVIEQGPNMEDAVHINPGQQIQFTDATVHDASSLAQLGGSLDDEARRILSDQKAFLVVDPQDITIVSR